MYKIFTLVAATMIAATSFAGNKAIQVTTTEAKSNNWESQLVIQLPKALVSGTKYTITMDVKGSSAIAADASLALGSFVEDNQSTNKDTYSNSKDLQYISNFPLTTDWANVSLGQTDGNFPYDRLILNIGALNGDMFVDNLVIKDADGKEYINLDFEDGISSYASKRSWHSHVAVSEYDSANDDVKDWGLKVTTTTAKTNNYDSQVLIKLPAALETGKKYNITMDVKGSVAIAGDATPALGGLIEDSQSTNQDEWSNSKDLQYINNFPLTTDWTNVSLGQTDGNFPYDRIILNIGALNGDMTIDNLKLTAEDGTVVATVNFDEGIAAASTRSWHSHVSIDKTPSDASSSNGIANIKATAEQTKTVKMIVNGKVVIVKNNATFNTLGQQVK